MWAPPQSDLEKGNTSSFHRCYPLKGSPGLHCPSSWAQGPWRGADPMSQVLASPRGQASFPESCPRECICIIDATRSKVRGPHLFTQNPIQQSFG